MSKNKYHTEQGGTDRSLTDEIGDNHIATSPLTPLRKDAFDLSADEKIAVIEEHFTAIMEALGLDLSDHSLKGTPHRVAKMYVKEIFSGLDPKNKPIARKFDNNYDYRDMVVEKKYQCLFIL